MKQTRTYTWIPGVVLPLISIALTVFALIKTRHLSTRVATHWSLDGAANGSMSVTALRLTTLLVVAAAVALMIAGVRRHRPATAMLRVASAVGAIFAFLFPLVTLTTAAANDGIANWRLVPGPATWTVLGTVALAFTAAVIAIVCTPSPAPAPLQPDGLAIQLAAGERAVWVSSAHNRIVFGGGAATIAAGSLTVVLTRIWAASIPLLIIGVALAGLSTITVRIDAGGLTIHYGVLPIRTHFALEEIEGAEQLDLKPLQWGGWGYRGSLRALGRAAVVIRSGDGIRLLVNGKEFGVTVDDASTGVALLNGLMRQHAEV